MDDLRNQWFCPQTDLSESFIKSDYESILEYVTENLDTVFLACGEDNKDSFDGLIKLGLSIQNRFEASTVGDVPALSVIYEMGVLTGVVRAWSRIRTEERQVENVSRRNQGANLRIKHLGEIIDLLDEFSYLSHNELSKKLRMKASALTACMKNVLETQLVMCRRSGKYKVYSLTDYGFQYKKSLGKHPELIQNKESILESIEQSINAMSRDDGEWLMDKLERMVSTRAYVFHKGDKFRVASAENGLSLLYRFNGRWELTTSKQESSYAILAEPCDKKISVREVQNEEIIHRDLKRPFSKTEYDRNISRDLFRRVM